MTLLFKILVGVIIAGGAVGIARSLRFLKETSFGEGNLSTGACIALVVLSALVIGVGVWLLTIWVWRF